MLSRHSQLAEQSLRDIRRQELKMPLYESTERPPNLEEQLAIFGGWQRWRDLADQDRRIKEKSLRRHTHRNMRVMQFREVFGGATTLLAGVPKMLLTDAVVGGSSAPASLDGARKDFRSMSTPYLFGYSPVITAGNRKREGGRQMARTISAMRLPRYLGSIILVNYAIDGVDGQRNHSESIRTQHNK